MITPADPAYLNITGEPCTEQCTGCLQWFYERDIAEHHNECQRWHMTEVVNRKNERKPKERQS